MSDMLQLAVTLPIMTPEPTPKRVRYLLDPGASTFTVQAFAAGLFSAFGHDPVIGIKDFSGAAEFVPDTFEHASLSLNINANSMTVINNVKESDRREIERMMREEVLETAKFPTIVFESHNITMSRAGAGRFRTRVVGDLTLHGISQKNLWINGEVIFNDEGFRAKGNCALKQTDYQIKLVSVAGGTMKIKNEVQCKFEIVAKRGG